MKRSPNATAKPSKPRGRRPSSPRPSPKRPAAPAEAAADAPGAIRLQKVLAAAGVGSRRHCEELIAAGRVQVDGRPVRQLGVRVDPDRQQILLDGTPIAAEKRVYYMVNKPTGFVSTNRDPQGRRRVIDLFPRSRERLFTVGRLDEASQGLMVVTNDGELANQLAHPRFGVAKTYRVQVAGVPTPEELQLLRTGIEFTEGIFKVAAVRRLKAFGKSAWLEIVLTEGQNREIRRLLAKIEHKVIRLERVAFGPLRLRGLSTGAFRPLTKGEIEALREAVAQQPRRGKAARSQ
ncbi:MAG TPA: pseudouridine synthase [Planctomycetaceae bacterium]|nr:pseudouridine synthase [Planctomycetaceae bacterium]